MTRGAFIAIEGLDRSGKSTQIASLAARLTKEGKKVEVFKFPERTTKIGSMINAYLQSSEELDDRVIHLLFSANRWELASKLRSYLDEGTMVLCDRYAFSGIAFSASKGIPLEWCRAPDIGLPRPDLVFFMDVSSESASVRGGYGEERYEKEDIQRKVKDVFNVLREEKGEGQASWETIDANREKEAVFEELWASIQRLVDGVHEPIGNLWTR